MDFLMKTASEWSAGTLSKTLAIARNNFGTEGLPQCRELLSYIYVCQEDE